MNAFRTCAIDGCEGVHDARGFCASHYNRWKRHGDPLAMAPMRAQRTCSVHSCDRPHRSSGYCNMHAQRYYKHGDPLKVVEQERKLCSVDGCESFAKGRGYCAKHLRRVHSTGSPHEVRRGGRPVVGDNPGWDAVHFRLRKYRGTASQHACVDCGGAAREWSYDNADDNELVDAKKNVAYSLSLNHYQPRCVKCHRQFDAVTRRDKKEGLPCMVLRVEELDVEELDEKGST